VLWAIDPLTRDRQRRLLAFSRFWCRLVWAMNPFWRMKVTGLSELDRSRPYVVVANHPSIGDILAAIHLPLSMRFVAKRELLWIPFWGWQLGICGHLPVRRGSRAAAARLVEDAARVLRHGQSVLFFPEGTRSTNGQVGPFKNGAFHAALRAGACVLPVCVAGTGDAMPRGSIVFKGRAFVRLDVLPPVPVDGLDADDPVALGALRSRVREAIASRKPSLEREVEEGLSRWSDLAGSVSFS
jgi:1-acyl-sn-glycerol-3-phosphate acyltransferase